MQLRVNKRDLENSNGEGGLEIIIEGVKGDPTCDPSQPIPVFIEYYKGEYRVLVWNDSQEPELTVLKKQ
jgi:hypothetical protein